MILSPWRAGLALGGLVGLAHAVWAAFVALGVAQVLVDFILRLHFLQVSVTMAPFDIGVASILVGFTASFGFVMGAGFAILWNRLHQASVTAAPARAA
jgi:hypothetical protein